MPVLALGALVRIWRELLAGTTSMQGGFSMAVCDPGDGTLTPLAREHFGALTPLRAYAHPDQVLAEVSQGKASVAVLPYPSDDNDWWVALLHHQPRLHIVAQLPFWKPRPEGFPPTQALVVAAAPPDASEADRSFIGLECDNDIAPARLHSELANAGFEPATIARVRTPKLVNVLVEVSGLLADTDPRLTRLTQVLRPPVVFGGYAVPLDGVVS